VLTIEPAISVKSLSSVKPGTFAIVDGAYAFVLAPAKQPTLRMLAVYDKSDSKFKYKYADTSPSIIEFSGNVVLQPDFSTTFEARPSQTSTMELFLDGSRPSIVVHLPSDFRLLDLASGQLDSGQRSEMKAFGKWTVGVRDSSSAPVLTVAAF
jgi:hypothetical protein